MFLKVIFPVLIIIVLSYILSKFKKLEHHILSVLAIYILSPALILRAFDMHGELLIKNSFLTSLHLILYVIVMYVISKYLAKLLKLSNRSKYSLILLSFLPNTGNIGIPVIELYLGTEGSSYATLILVITSILTQTYGVYIASRGSSNLEDSRKSLENAIKNVISLPLIYVSILGFILSIFSIKLPFFLKEPIYNLGFSALILGLIQLGIVLGKTKINFVPLKFVISANLLKLVVAPIVAASIGYLIGFRGIELKVIILQFAMPSALYCSILSSYFNLIPKTVGVTVFISTTMSFITLYILIEILQFF